MHTFFKSFCHGLVCVLAIFTMPPPPASAQSEAVQVVEIDGAAPVKDLQGSISYFLDETHTLDIGDVAQSSFEGAFETVTTAEPDFQYTKSAIWLRIPVKNTQPREIDMRVVFHTNFMTEFAVYKVTGDSVDVLLKQTEVSPFSARLIPHPNIVIPLTLAPEEKAWLYLRYRSRGSTTLPIRIETLSSFDAWSQSYTAKLFIFYAVMFAFAVVSAVAFVVTPRAIFLSYSFYAVCVILYIGQRDGVAFQYFWPNAPIFNGYASLPLGCLVGLAAAIFARIFLGTKDHYRGADLFLRVFIAGCIAIPFSAFVIGESPAKKLATYWVTLGAVSFLVIGLRAMRGIQPRILFYVAGWFGIVFATILVTARDVMGISAGRSETLDIVRAATMFDATMMGLAMTAAILHIRHERDKSWRERIVTLQANLALHERLNAVENRYEQAATEAENRGRVLANASHDIRQPLFALRAALRELEQSGDPSKTQVDSIERSLNYIEALVDDYRKETLDDETAGEGVGGPTTPVQMIFDAVQAMFSGEASAKDVRLAVVPTSQTAAVEAFPLMRIMTNLAANAIAYTPSGKVLVGCRRSGGRILLEVYDTGPGLAPEQLKTVLNRGQRGETIHGNPDGEGFGLSIVQELCETQGLEFTVKSTPGKGSCFRISAPAA